MEKLLAAMPAKPEGKARLAADLTVATMLPADRDYYATERAYTSPIGCATWVSWRRT